MIFHRTVGKDRWTKELRTAALLLAPANAKRVWLSKGEPWRTVFRDQPFHLFAYEAEGREEIAMPIPDYLLEGKP